MDSELVRTFLQVLDARGYHPAADLNRRSASAMHKDIRRLEAQLGVKLFFTIGRQLEPTADAVTLEPDLRGLVALADQVAQSASDITRGDSGLIRIACWNYQLGRFLAVANRMFSDEHANVKIDLHLILADVRADVDAGKAALLRGVTDLSVTRVTDPQFDAIELWRTVVTVVTPDDHPYRNQDAVSINDLEGKRLITAGDSYWSRRQLDYAASAAGVEFDIIFESTPDALYAAALAGVGIAVFGDDHLLPPPSRPYPVLLDKNGEQMSVGVNLTWVRERHQPRAVREYIEFMRANHEVIDRRAQRQVSPSEPPSL